MSADTSSALYNISTVANMLGVNAVTLRAWERRYQLINPKRTEAGHRLYSNEDIETIKVILQLLDEGIAISRVKQALAIASNLEQQDQQVSSHWDDYIERMLNGVNDFDEAVLDEVYNEAMSLYPVDVVTKQLILPLMYKLGVRWQKLSTGVAEEHFTTVFLRNKLGARFHHRNLQNTGPRIIAACLPGENHEFGILLFALAAHARGYRIILLGADMPVKQIIEVVRRTNSKGVVLSGSVELDIQQLQEDLIQLTEDTNVPVWVGGSSSDKYREQIEDSGAMAVGSDLIVGLHQINKKIPL